MNKLEDDKEQYHYSTIHPLKSLQKKYSDIIRLRFDMIINVFATNAVTISAGIALGALVSYISKGSINLASCLIAAGAFDVAVAFVPTIDKDNSKISLISAIKKYVSDKRELRKSAKTLLPEYFENYGNRLGEDFSVYLASELQSKSHKEAYFNTEIDNHREDIESINYDINSINVKLRPYEDIRKVAEQRICHPSTIAPDESLEETDSKEYTLTQNKK